MHLETLSSCVRKVLMSIIASHVFVLFSKGKKKSISFIEHYLSHSHQKQNLRFLDLFLNEYIYFQLKVL